MTEKSQTEMLHPEKHSQPHEEITFLSLVILSSLLLWLNGNFFWSSSHRSANSLEGAEMMG